MNSTNRALNRALVLLAGLLLAAAGAAVALAALLPAARDLWDSTAATAAAGTDGLLAGTALGDTGASWLLVVLALLSAGAVVALVAFVLRQGHGQTSTLLTRATAGAGAGDDGIVVRSALAAQSIGAALEPHGALLSSHISAYRVRGTPVLKVSVTARRGASPAAIRQDVESVLADWDAQLGSAIPALISIGSGVGSRWAARSRPTARTADPAPPGSGRTTSNDPSDPAGNPRRTTQHTQRNPS